MKPKKMILLVGTSENKLGILRFMLHNTMKYRVTSVSNIDKAVSELRRREYELLFIYVPIKKCGELISMASTIHHSMPKLLLVPAGEKINKIYADIALYNPRAEEILERLMVITKRSRGPKVGSKKKKPVVSESVILEEAVA